MKKIFLFTLLFLPLSAFAAETSSTWLQMFDSFFSTDAYGWVDTFFERAAAWVIYSWIDFKIWSLQFSYNVASMVIESLGVTQEIESRLSGMSSEIYAFVSWLRIIEALNIIFSAHAATMIMRLF